MNTVIPALIRGRITGATIIRETARGAGLRPEDLTGYSRRADHVWPRFCAIKACREYAKMSLPQIGRIFNRHHTTILNALRRFDELADADAWDAVKTIAERAEGGT